MINFEKIKKEFPIFNEKNLIYFDSASTTQKPLMVIDAMTYYYKNYNANIHRGIYKLSIVATNAYDGSKQAVAEFINAKSAEIIFTSGTTMGINLLANNFKNKLTENDEILISALEHHSNLVPWQELSKCTGAKLKIIPINDKNLIDIEKLKSMLNSNVKILSVTQMSNVLGEAQNIKEIIELTNSYNIFTVVDGAQYIAHDKVDVKDLNCDAYVFSSHKIYGPTGVGILYIKENKINEIDPIFTGGDMIETVAYEKTSYKKDSGKFEAGTQNIAGIIGLKSAIDFINQIGMQNIKSHINELYKFAYEKLSGIEGIKILSTENSNGILSFTNDKIHPHDIATFLDFDGIAVRAGNHCAEPLMKLLGINGCTRISFGIYNSKDEIEKTFSSLKKVISHLA